jgi:predicted aconitase with swiveling domain
LTGEVIDKRVDADGEHVVDVSTVARNQRGETVMPGSAVIALPTRDGADSPAARRAHRAHS